MLAIVPWRRRWLCLVRGMSTQPKKLAEQVTLPKADKKAVYENPVADFWKLKVELLKQ